MPGRGSKAEASLALRQVCLVRNTITCMHAPRGWGHLEGAKTDIFPYGPLFNTKYIVNTFIYIFAEFKWLNRNKCLQVMF